MTISLAPTKYRYEGNGVTAVFSFPNRVYATTDLKVDIITRATSALVETLTLTTHYTVAIAANGHATVTITAPAKIPTASQDILIRADYPLTQTKTLPTATVFPAKTVETAIDKLTSISQQLNESDGRGLKYSPQTATTSTVIAEPVADAVLTFNGTTGAIKAGPTIGQIAEAEANADRAEAAAATVAVNNYAATTDPTVNDDSGDGYSAGSQWVNTTTDTKFTCVDATLAAAIWKTDVMQGDSFQAAAGSAASPSVRMGDANSGLRGSGNATIVVANGTDQWSFDDGIAKYMKSTGVAICGNTSDGSDTGALVLGGGGAASTTRGAVMSLYGEQHPVGAGWAFLTAATDADVGKIALENSVYVRRGMVINARASLTAGAYDPFDVNFTRGVVQIFGDATAGSDPTVSGYTPSTSANTLVVEKQTGSHGISIAGEDTATLNLYFAKASSVGVGGFAYDLSADQLITRVGGSERFRAGSSVMLMGKTASDAATAGIELTYTGQIQSTRASNINARFNRSGTDGTSVEFRKDNTVCGTISVSTGATAYNTSSDARLKENVQDYASGLADILKLAPKTYNMVADPQKRGQMGLIAQEVQEHFPNLVNKVSDDENAMLALDYSKFVPMLLSAVQELAGQVQELRAKVGG